MRWLFAQQKRLQISSSKLSPSSTLMLFISFYLFSLSFVYFVFVDHIMRTNTLSRTHTHTHILIWQFCVKIHDLQDPKEISKHKLRRNRKRKRHVSARATDIKNPNTNNFYIVFFFVVVRSFTNCLCCFCYCCLYTLFHSNRIKNC